MSRIVLAGVIAGVIVFVWSAFSHMVLPIGEMGLRSLPEDPALLASLKGGVPESGLYFYPGMDPAQGSAKEAQEAWEAKLRTGPSGLLLIHRDGQEPMSAGHLVQELIANILAGIVLAAILARIPLRAPAAAGVAALLGLFGWLNISASHAIWYGFPAGFVAAEAIDQGVGWFLAGLAAAAFLRRGTAPRRLLR